MRFRIRAAALGALVLVLVSGFLAQTPLIQGRAQTAASYTIWNGSPYIANWATPDSGSVEVGVKFRADVAGQVTAVRFFKGTGNTGTHVGNLWTSNGTLLATVTFNSESASGWQQATFATPVSVTAGVTYIASYFAPNGHYAVTTGLTPGDFNTNVDNPPLHALASGVDGANGTYAYAPSSTFPNRGSPSATNYWVDVVLSATVTATPVAGNFLPANGAAAVPQSTQITAQFSEEVQPTSLTFTLTDPGGAGVPAQVTWELHQADRTVTLDPIGNLAPGTLYTAHLSGGTDRAGNVMAPVTWSFVTKTSSSPAPAAAGQWQPVQKWPLVAVHASVLRTGKFVGFDPDSPVTTSQQYDPASGSFTAANMMFDMFCAGMAQMADGRLIIAGGDHGDNPFPGPTYGNAINQVVAYDPAAGTWARLADMRLTRWYPAMVRLGDGRILAISGQQNNVTWSDTPEVYDPASNTWTLLSAVNTSDVHEDLYPNAYLLPDGRVLVIATSTGHTWILDVNAQTWTAGPATSIQNGSSVMYRPGRILLSGGSSKGYGSSTVAAAAVLDMTAPTPAWQAVAPMNVARGYQQLTVLPDGRVLAAGGSPVFTTSSLSGILPSEIWDPTANTWTVMSSMQDMRNNHSTGVLMPDGTYLAAGGGHELGTGAYDYFTAETFSPPYLYNGSQPVISAAPASAAYGATITVQTPNASSIASVALIGLAAETHHLDSGATYRSLPFAVSAGQLNVTMPATTGLAPPGYYMLFLVNSTGVPSIASMIQLTGTDATPPAVVATTPANGANQVSVTTAPAATFTKAVLPSTIQFSLQDNTGQAVSTTTSYSSVSNTATFTTAVPLHYATTYTATGAGASDIAGHPMTAPYTWSFTTASPPSCPCTIWNSSATPGTPSAADSAPIELGVKFQPDSNGYITGVQFYKGPTNSGSHLGNLWASNGTLLASVAFTNESATGWQSATFASPVAVTAGSTYVASYFAPAGGYAYDAGYFTNTGHDNSPLHALQASASGGNGVFTYGSASTFPTVASGRDANYWVDATFAFTLSPHTTPPAVTATNPAGGATGVAVGIAPSATFNEAVQPGSINFSLKDAASNAIAGAVSYNASKQAATFTPASPLASSTRYSATVSGATDVYGNTMSSPVSWSFTTQNCPCTIWSASAVPGIAATTDSNSLELGLKFRTDTNGYVTGLRFYKGPGNGGSHIGDLWSSSGTRLASVTFSTESATGWQDAAFSSAVAVSAGITYVVSYFAPQGHYAYDSQYFSSSGIDSAPLHALRAGVDGGNAVFTYSSSSAFPNTASASSPNYWVDPIFEPGTTAASPPMVAAQSPTPGSNGVATSATITATFSKAVQPNSVAFGVVDPSGASVAGAVSYDPLTHISTFWPSARLQPATTYTATITTATDLGGNVMSSPVSWSFTTVASACPCTLWSPSTTPATSSINDSNSVELGVQFTSDIGGHVTGVRLYKGVGNGGVHVGHLWSATGTLLATVTFSGETASGWQQATFSTPVAINAGTVYVISYLAPQGHYSYDSGYFTSGYDNAPLHAIAQNAVYMYSSSGAFPSTVSPAHGNYWVDVVLGS